MSRARKSKVLARLMPEEGGVVLRALLQRHPELVAEAEAIATAMLTDVDAEAVAHDVAQAALDLGTEDLGMRAGRKNGGYVAPSQAAWELLQESVDPFLNEMKRHIELGFEEAATGTCAGIVLGLYRCLGKNADAVLGWAEDFPVETARGAVETLACESAARHRRTWLLPDAVVTQAPDWADMLERAAKPPSRRR